MKYIWLILFAVLSLNIANADVLVSDKDNGVSIKLTNINPKISHINNTWKIELLKDNQWVNNPISNSIFPNFNFRLALADEDTKINIIKLEKRLVARYEINSPSVAINAFFANKGIQRDIIVANLIINPIEYNPITNELFVIENMEIFVDYGRKVKANNSISSSESSVFSDLINYSKVSGLKIDKPKIKDATLDNYWYNPNVIYAKINTSRDGIAKIDCRELFNIMPEFKSIASNSIHLIHNGIEQSIYIKDDNQILDENDIIYFLASRPKGDTTWFNTYSNYEPYFLYVDNEKTPLRSELIDYKVTTNKLNKVFFNQHIEFDNLYFEGREPLYIENEPLEGWYWTEVSRSRNNEEAKKFKFSYPLLISTNDDTEFIDIKIKYSTMSSKIPDPRVPFLGAVIANSDTIYNINLNYQLDTVISHKIEKSKLFDGVNTLELVNYKMNDRVETIGIDYIEYSGSIRPIALSSEAEFTATAESESNLDIPGFNSNSGFAFDKLSKKLFVTNNTKGFRLAVNAKNGNSAIVSTVINDSIYYNSSEKGILISTYNYELKEYKSAFLKDNNTAFSYLNNINSNVVLSFVYNLSEPIDSKIRNLLTNYGATKINMHQAGDVYTLIGKKSGEKIFEEMNSNSISYNSFIEDLNVEYYKASIYLDQAGQYDLIINSNDRIENTLIERVNQTNLRADNIAADVIILSHPNFKDGVKPIQANHQARGLRSFIVDVNDVYNQFGNGIKSPHSIKKFLQFAQENWVKPSPLYLILVGDASWDARKKSKNAISNDYVPTYGKPVCDYWYSLVDGDSIPEMIVGRIPVINNSELESYIDKINVVTNQKPAPWMKNLLYLTGGLSDQQREAWAGTKYIFFDLLSTLPFCFDSSSVAKYDPKVASEKETAEILQKINSGAFWVNFLGHASSQTFDMDGWWASALNNKDKYGIVTTLSCNASAFAEPLAFHSRNEEYVLEKDKGFFASMGSTTVGFTDASVEFLYKLFIAMKDTVKNYRRIGDLMNYTKLNMYGAEIAFLTRYHYALLGDPTIEVPIKKKISPYIYEPELKIIAQDPLRAPMKEDNYVKINGILNNLGFGAEQVVKLNLVREYKNIKDTFKLEFLGLCLKQDFEFFVTINQMAGEHNFEIFVQIDSLINQPLSLYKGKFFVFATNLILLDPKENWNVDYQNPLFRFINPLPSDGKYSYNFEILNTIDSTLVYSSKSEEILISETNIDWKPNIQLTNNNKYILKYRINNDNTGISSDYVYSGFSCYEYTPKIVKSNYSSNYDSKRIIKNSMQNYSENSLKLGLKSNEFKYELLAVSGNPTGEAPERWGKLIINDDFFFNYYGPTGFKVLRINKYNYNDKTYKTFEMWDDTLSSAKLVKFLRNEVSENDYLLIATAGQSFRMPCEIIPKLFKRNPKLGLDTLIGHQDTLKAELRKFGAVLVDSFQNNVSYVFFGYRGAVPGSMPEKVKYIDTAQIKGVFHIVDTLGYADFDEFGPLRKIKSIDYSIENPDNKTNTKLYLKGLNSTTLLEDTILVFEEPKVYQLDTLNVSNYKYLKTSLEMSNSANGSNAYLKSLTLTYEPVPELAVLQSKIDMIPDTVLAADTFNLDYSFKNLSLRTKLDSASVNIKALNSSDIYYDLNKTVYNVPENSLFKELALIPSENLYFENDIIIKIDNENLSRELYKFNNSMQTKAYVYSDTVKPTVKVFIDNNEIVNNQFVSKTPIIRVELYDNSRKKVNSNNLLLRVNGSLLNQSNTLAYEFKDFGSNIPKKAELTVQLDTLKEIENSLFVYFSDDSRNRDTLFYILKTTINSAFNKHYIFPNPATDNISLYLDYKAPSLEGIVNISIFDETGRKVKNIKFKPGIGINKIPLDLFNDNGESLSSGIYYYSLELENIYADPDYGKFIIVR